MSTLILTDLHYTDRPRTMLRHQVDCVKRILNEVRPTRLILMGDLMMHRKPSPTVLLALDETFRHARKYTGDITILRGNHDSENKSDDGVTALSLFDRNEPGSRCKVVTQFYIDHNTKRIFIPHYEKEETIRMFLKEASEYPDYTVFGHFGYQGCLNSAGDQDFSLKLSNFKNKTWLGHIHKAKIEDNVTVLGTPYTTNFGECGKVSFYGLLEEGFLRAPLEEIQHGPRHLCYDIDSLNETLIEDINDSDYNTYLRLFVNRLTAENLESLAGDVLKDLDVVSIDIKYKPVDMDDEQSDYKPERDLFSINEVILEDYIDRSSTTLEKDDLLEGLRLLRDED